MKGGMQQLMKQAQQMQRKMEQLQQDLAEKVTQASAGGGMVTVEINGKREVLSVRIDPQVVDPEDIEMLQDLITAAFNEGLRLVEENYKEEMGKIVPMGMMGGMPGLF